MKRRCRETGACLDREKLGLFYFFKFSINPEIADISQPKPIIGSVKNFVALVKNGSFLVRITDMTILIEKEFIYGSSKRPNPTDY